MTSGGGGGKKQEEPSGIFRFQREFVDRIKEDGIRRELYERERKAEENWDRKWEFLKNPRRLWEDEAAKRGMPPDIFDRKNQHRKPPPWPESRKPKIQILPSGKFPRLSSEFIGWRSSSKENNLDRMTGPMFESPKQTMEPPLHPDEPDLRTQKFIFLG